MNAPVAPLAAPTVPAAVGGGGAGLRVSARVVEAVGAACPATALMLAMQYLKHAALARNPAWPDALRQRVQEAIGKVEGLIAANRRIAEALAPATDAGEPPATAEAGALKVLMAENAVRAAQAHEEAGFDRVLVAWGSTSPDALLVAAHAAAATSRIGFMVAHRPGFVAPTLAARQFATFDHLSNGRAAIQVISDGSPAEQRKDGDRLSHGERYGRMEEYVPLLKRLQTSAEPFGHEGIHCRFEGGFSETKPLQQPRIPVYFGGSSDVAIDIAGRLADVQAFWGETLDQARDTIARVRDSAARAGRDPASVRFSLSVRPVLADTEEAAWARAHRIIARIRELRSDTVGSGGPKPESVGSERLLEAAAGGRGRAPRPRRLTAAASETRDSHAARIRPGTPPNARRLRHGGGLGAPARRPGGLRRRLAASRPPARQRPRARPGARGPAGRVRPAP